MSADSCEIGQFWRLGQVEREIGLKKSFVYQAVREGKFPRSFKVGRAALWDARDIRNWQTCVKSGRQWGGQA